MRMNSINNNAPSNAVRPQIDSSLDFFIFDLNEENRRDMVFSLTLDSLKLFFSQPCVNFCSAQF